MVKYSTKNRSKLSRRQVSSKPTSTVEVVTMLALLAVMLCFIITAYMFHKDVNVLGVILEKFGWGLPAQASTQIPNLMATPASTVIEKRDIVETRLETPMPTKPTKRTQVGPSMSNLGEEIYIRKIPGRKTGLKQDMRVVLPSAVHQFERPEGSASSVVGQPRGYLSALAALKEHPLHKLQGSAKLAHNLEETMSLLYNSSSCRNKPLFLSMATVGDDLYWQLIENFVYTMVKFDTIHCSLVICVSDAKCMKMCKENNFPCYSFQSSTKPLPSVMEQIGEVKLYHVPKALAKGVDVFMLDLDVGFLYDPMLMVDAFYATPKIDIFVQEDMIFIMNRSKAGWKTWYTEPLPNIGLFLCRGNEKTVRMFSIAWMKYNKMSDSDSKKNPGKDQNHVLDAMRIGRGTFGLRFAYFGNSTAVLLDKLVYYTSRSVELGGEASSDLFAHHETIAVHTTCYEHTTKVLGLKATNSFWNPKYYDPLRLTLTKQIIFISEMQVLEEIRSLMWLAIRTGRSLIIPNILGREDIEGGHVYRMQVMWPGFRVAKLKRSDGKNTLSIEILEPAFYWRVARDYDEVPSPTILYYSPQQDSLEDILQRLATLGNTVSRVVLQPKQPADMIAKTEKEVVAWATNSVGLFSEPYSIVKKSYKTLPSVKKINRNTQLVTDVLQGVRNCQGLLTKHRGNRSCFQICD